MSVNRAGLVAKKVQVTRNGKTFTQTVYVASEQNSTTNVPIKAVAQPNTPGIIEAFEEMAKTDRKAAMALLQRAGITWKENVNEGINWMRAKMAAKAYKAPDTSPAKPSVALVVEPKRVDTTVYQPKMSDGGIEDSHWNKKMKGTIKPLYDEIENHARDLLPSILKDIKDGKITADQFDTAYGGYQGRADSVESKKFFNEGVMTSSRIKHVDAYHTRWKKAVANNVRARISLYNQTAKRFANEYNRRLRDNERFGTGWKEEQILRCRCAANIASYYAKSAKSYLDEWLAPPPPINDKGQEVTITELVKIDRSMYGQPDSIYLEAFLPNVAGSKFPVRYYHKPEWDKDNRKCFAMTDSTKDGGGHIFLSDTDIEAHKNPS